MLDGNRNREAPRVNFVWDAQSGSVELDSGSKARYSWTANDLWRLPERPGRYAIHGYNFGREVFESDCRDLRRRMLHHFHRRDLPFQPAYVIVSVDHV